MDGVNVCHIVGKVYQDPESRQTGGGNPVVNLRVVTSYRGTATWHRCVVFGKTAEFTAEHVRQDDTVYVSGRIDHREYEKDGQKRISMEIVAFTLQLLSGKSDRAPKELNGNTYE